MRTYVLYCIIAALAIYAWRDWFISLCGLVILTALMGHPDMPRSMFEIQGLNLWNVLFVSIVVPWLIHRRQQGLTWDAPRWVKLLFGWYVLTVVVAFLRAAADIDSFPVHSGEAAERITMSELASDHLINSLKYVAPAVLLFDGARTRRRLIIGLLAVLGMACYFGVVIVKNMPIRGLAQTGKIELKQRSRIAKRVGFHANSAAMICATGFWGILSLSYLRRRRYHLILLLVVAAIMALALAHCRSRAGWLALAGVGFLFAVFLWRWLLIALPVGIWIVCLLFPGIPQRMMTGVGVTSVSGEEVIEMDAVSAGRTTTLWPPVIDQIGQSPIIGYGRLGILRTPAYDKIMAAQGGAPEHPHNAYLQILLDAGIAGAVPVLALYGAILFISIRLFTDRREPLLRVVGGASMAAVASLLIMGISGQTFFPKENAQMSWCLYAIALRAWVGKRKRPLNALEPTLAAARNWEVP